MPDDSTRDESGDAGRAGNPPADSSGDRDGDGASASDDAIDGRSVGDAGSGERPTESAGASQQSSAAEDPRDTKFCTSCGEQIDARAEVCPECGVRQQDAAPSAPASKEKESGISALLSFLFPGLGQLYNGQVARGGLIFVVWIIWEVVALVITTFTLGFFILIWIPIEFLVHFIAAYDAYDQAEKINEGAVVV